jgi:integrase
MAEKRRRASGQGSVYQTADKRGWHASLTYYDATGKRRRIHRRARTQALATKALREAQTRLDAGRPLRDAPTRLADFLPRWLESGHVQAVKPRTYDAYQWAAGKLTAELGTETLARLTAEKIDRAYGRMVAGGLKPSSIQVVHAALHLALDQARRWKLVSTSPPTPPRRGWAAPSARCTRRRSSPHS